MSFVRIFAVMMLGFATAGCDLDSVWEYLNKGTTKGFNYCMVAGKNCAHRALTPRI